MQPVLTTIYTVMYFIKLRKKIKFHKYTSGYIKYESTAARPLHPRSESGCRM